MPGLPLIGFDRAGILLENVKQSRFGMNLVSDERRPGKIDAIMENGGEGNIVEGK